MIFMDLSCCNNCGFIVKIFTQLHTTFLFKKTLYVDMWCASHCKMLKHCNLRTPAFHIEIYLPNSLKVA